MAGRLVVVATPIGNLGDLSPRARLELAGADGWVVEDTRVSARIRTEVGSSARMTVLNDHSTAARIEAIVERLAAGDVLALLTDAGTPVVSDPGSALIDAAYDAGADVDAIPGPSAVTTALAVSGFYGQRYAFLGYLPRKAGPAGEVLLPYAVSTTTIVLFESPHRIDATISSCLRVLGSRRIAVCRELTKRHQQVWRGTLDEPPSEAAVPRKGEFTLVVEGLRRTGAHESV